MASLHNQEMKCYAGNFNSHVALNFFFKANGTFWQPNTSDASTSTHVQLVRITVLYNNRLLV